MPHDHLSRRELFGVVGVGVASATDVLAETRRRPLDNNLQVVDLTDLTGDLPLTVASTKTILQQTEDWKHSTWQNPDYPKGGGDTVGYPTVVRNTHGPRPDGKYYLYYAHHDPRSGIGVAVSDHLTGPYRKSVLVPGRSDNQVVPSFHSESANPDDPSHNSSPWVVWNSDDRLWHLYFHFYNHAHGPKTNYQPTGLAVTNDLASHRWTIVQDAKSSTVPAWLNALPTTKATWADEASSYNTVHRLLDGRWLAFVRGTSSDGRPTKLGFATSKDGRVFDYHDGNPVIHQNDGGKGRQGVYRPAFIGYLGKTSQYLVAWQESHPFDGDPRLIYGYTTDFRTIRRDPRGHVSWRGSDGAISAWRDGDRLFLFSGKVVHEIALPVR